MHTVQFFVTIRVIPRLDALKESAIAFSIASNSTGIGTRRSALQRARLDRGLHC